MGIGECANVRVQPSGKGKNSACATCHCLLRPPPSQPGVGGCAGGGQVGDFHVAPDLPWVRIGAEGVVHERHRYPTLLAQQKQHAPQSGNPPAEPQSKRPRLVGHRIPPGDLSSGAAVSERAAGCLRPHAHLPPPILTWCRGSTNAKRNNGAGQKRTWRKTFFGS